MYYHRYNKYRQKIERIIQGGGASPNDYILTFGPPPRWPRQIDDPKSTESWIYCPLIWMALDQYFDSMKDGNITRNFLLEKIGRQGEHKFFPMVHDWFYVIKQYDMKNNTALEQIIRDIIYCIVSIAPKIPIARIHSDPWHIRSNVQNDIIQRCRGDAQHTRYILDPKKYIGIPIRDFLLSQSQQKLSISSVPNPYIPEQQKPSISSVPNPYIPEQQKLSISSAPNPYIPMQSRPSRPSRTISTVVPNPGVPEQRSIPVNLIGFFRTIMKQILGHQIQKSNIRGVLDNILKSYVGTLTIEEIELLKTKCLDAFYRIEYDKMLYRT